MAIRAPETIERVQVRAPFQFRQTRVPLPRPLDADYLVRVDVCGLCRSDLHAAASWAIGWQEIGHEFGGTVIAASRSGGRFSVGERVAVRNAAACGRCDPCRHGRPRSCGHLVVNMQGFSDFALCDERSLEHAGDLADDTLALVEPTNVVLDLLHAARVGATHRVVVVGAGTLGLLTAYLARRAWGVPRVLVVGRRATSPLADHLGVAYMSAGEAVDADRLRGALGAAADRVLVTTPPSTLEQALSFCRPGGAVLTVGLDETERCRISLDVSRLIFGQYSIRGVCAAPNAHFAQARHAASRARPRPGGADYTSSATRTPRAMLREWQKRPHYDGKTILVNRPEDGTTRETAVA